VALSVMYYRTKLFINNGGKDESSSFFTDGYLPHQLKV